MAAAVLTGMAFLLVGAIVFLAVLWFLLPGIATNVCQRCGARVRRTEQGCAVCGMDLPRPAEGHPGAGPYGFPLPRPRSRESPRVEGGEAFNRGITKGVVTAATLAMALGIGLRLVGMLGALGLPQVPPVVDGALTIAGGVIAFVGFVFLDAA